MIADVWAAIGPTVTQAASAVGIGLAIGLVALVYMTIVVVCRHCRKP